VDDWLISAADRLAANTGMPRSELDLIDWDIERLLRVARTASEHSGERTNAPLLCFLLGLTAGQMGVSLDQLIPLFPE
jgi:hypothetical protein